MRNGIQRTRMKCIRQSSLERVGLSKGGVVLNKKAIISAGELIRSKIKQHKGK